MAAPGKANWRDEMHLTHGKTSWTAVSLTFQWTAEPEGGSLATCSLGRR